MIDRPTVMGGQCSNCGAGSVASLPPFLLCCKQCGFVSVEEPERERQQAIFFHEDAFAEDKVIKLLAKYPRDAHPKKDLYAGWARRLARALAEPSSRVLDVGASGGAFLNELEQLGIASGRLELLEGDPNYVEYSARTYGYASRRENIEDFNGAERAYGLVTMFDVLEHVHRFDRALANIHRMLRPDGLFFLKLPSGRWAMAKYRMARLLGLSRRIPRLLYLEPGGHLNYWSPRNIGRLRRFGFELVEVGSVPPTRRQFGPQYWWRAIFHRIDRLAGTDLFPEFYVLMERAK